MTLKKILLAPLVVFWTLALVLEGIPDNLRLDAIATPRAWADRMFRELQVQPSQAVFPGRYGQWKRRTACWTVLGVTADKEVRTLHATYEGCDYPLVRWRNRTFDTTLTRLNQGAMSRMALPKRRAKQLKRLRKSRAMSKISRFFCRSDHVEGREGVERVYSLWLNEGVHYRSGKVSTALNVVHQYDCKRRRRGRWTWPTVEIHAEEGPRIVDLEPPRRRSPQVSKGVKRRKAKLPQPAPVPALTAPTPRPPAAPHRPPRTEGQAP